MSKSAVLLALSVLLPFAGAARSVSAAGGEDEAPSRRSAAEVLASLPRSVYSSDGFVQVTAYDPPEGGVGFRGPLLQAASQEIRDLARTFKLDVPHRLKPAVVVRACDGRTNDVRVLTRVRRASEGVTTYITLPSPGFSDVETFRLEVARAFFRVWAEVPDWVAAGALSTIDPETARRDRCVALDLWFDARLPTCAALVADMRLSRGRGAALNGFLVDWMRETGTLRKALLAGAWSTRAVTADLTGTAPGDAVAQDRVCDERFVRLAKSVLAPGRASEADVRLFASRLLLYPSDFDKKFEGNAVSFTFREALAAAEKDSSVRIAALVKAQRLEWYALGRGDALEETARAYAAFLRALARADAKADERMLLDAADAALEKAYEECRKDDNW